MGGPPGRCSSVGNGNTGQTSNPHINTHTQRYGCTYTCTHQSRTNGEEETRQFGCPSCCDDQLGAQQALERNTEQAHATAAIVRAALAFMSVSQTNGPQSFSLTAIHPTQNI